MAFLTAIQQHRNPAMLGVGLILFGVSALSLQDAFIKLLASRYPIHEIMVVRTLFAIGPILYMVHLEGGLRMLRTGRTGLHLLRGAALFMAYYCYFLALAAMPMAEAVSIFFVSPLFVTLLSVIYLHERIDLAQGIILLVGFSGVLVMVRPGAAAIDPAALLAVGAALLYALMVVMTRYLGATSQGSVLAFYPFLVYIAGGSLTGLVLGDGRFATSPNPTLQFLLRAWQLPTGPDLALLAVAGVLAAAAFYALGQAYRLTRPSTIAPLEYGAMPLSALWGLIFFGDAPGGWTIAGMLLIGGSGWALARRNRAPRPALPSPAAGNATMEGGVS